MYDPTAPTATVKSVSGGFVDAAEDDGNVSVFATGNEALSGVAFSITDGADTLSRSGKRSGMYGEQLDNSTSAITLAASAQFGDAVAIDGIWMAVGASSEQKVRLIKDSDGDGRWADATSNDIITIDNSTAGISLTSGDAFGRAVALDVSAGLLAIGATGDDEGGSNRGAVYIVDDGGNSWADIVSDDVEKIDDSHAGLSFTDGDQFGNALAFDGSTLYVGSPYDNTGGTGGFANRGAVYIIADGGNNWTDVVAADVTEINDDTDGISLSNQDNFGTAVAYEDGLLFVGATNGAVYILQDTTGDGDYADTGEKVTLDNSTAGITVGSGDWFGHSVAMEDGLLAVGDRGAGGDNDTGVAYLIRGGGDNWASVTAADVVKLDQRLDGVTLNNSAFFGSAVALQDGTLAVGAYGIQQGGDSKGRVYVFDPAWETILATGDFEKGTNAANKLAEGTVTVTATPTDPAGNTGSGATGTFSYDQTVPTLTTGRYSGTTVTLTMSEAVWGTADADDFTVINNAGASQATVTPTAIAQGASAGAASATITLTVPATTWAGTVKAYYTKDSTKPIADAAGNELASITSANAVTLNNKTVTISDVSGDNYINGTEDDSAVLITGGSSDLTTGTSVTVAVDSADAGSAADHSFTVSTDSSGNWTTAATDLTVARLTAFAEGTITITASATGALSATKTVVYDRTAPTASLAGAPSGSSSVETLDVTVGGTGVTHYKKGVQAGNACVDAGYARSTLINDDSNIDDASGIASTSTHLYISQKNGGTVRAYTLAGARASSNDITLNSGNTDVEGMVADSTHLYVVDGDSTTPKVYAYTLSTGARDTSKEFDLASENDEPYSIAKSSTHFYVFDYNDWKVYAYTTAGVQVSGWSVTVASHVKFRGLTVAGGYLRGLAGRQIQAFSLTDGSAVASENLWFTASTGVGSYTTYDGLTAIGTTNPTYYGISRNIITSNDDVFKLTYSVTQNKVPGAETAVATKVTDDISGLAEGLVSVCAVGRDAAGNWQAETSATKVSWTKDTVVPTLTTGEYEGTTVTLVMSEAVWGSADADDFTVVNNAGVGSGTAVTPTGITQGANVGAASVEVVLTVPSTVWTGVVKAYYTQDSGDSTKRLKDAAGNVLASVGSGSAVTVTPETVEVSFVPADGGHLASLSGDLSVGFSGAVFTDSACGTAMDSTGFGNLFSLKEDDSSGAAIGHTVSYSGNTGTVDPSSDFADGDVVYMAVGDGWYYSVGGTCTQGAAANATVTVDVSGPSVSASGTGYYSNAGLSTALSGVGRGGG